MDETRKELLDIVTQVRGHLEYQNALGVRGIALTRPEQHPVHALPAAPAPSLSRKDVAVKTSPVVINVQENSIPASQPLTLTGIREELGDCVRCGLGKGRKNIVFGDGNPEAILVFVGEGPGSEEDQQGKPFVGEAGQLLTDIIVKGMKLTREEVYICNVVKCRPPGNRNPEPDEVNACEPFLRKQLAAIKPKVIVTLGNVPTHTLLKTKEGITRLRGKWQTYEGIPLMPTFHPAYLLRNPKDKKLVWEDIQLVMEKMGLEVPAKESGARSQESGEKPVEKQIQD